MKISKFIALKLPNCGCNLNCRYCFATSVRAKNSSEGFCAPVPDIVRALAPEKLGGPCVINILCDAEPFCGKHTNELIAGLLEIGHIVVISTNMTRTDEINDLITKCGPNARHLLFFASLHFNEIVRLGYDAAFFENLRKVREHNASWQMRLCLAPEYVGILENIKNRCFLEVGQTPILSRYRSSNSYEEKVDMLYLDSLAEAEKEPLYELLKALTDKKRDEYCKAGEISIVIDLSDGTVRPCLAERAVDNIFSNIPFKAIGYNCSAKWCVCGSQFLPWGMIKDIKVKSYYETFFRGNEGSITDEMRQILSQKIGD